MICAEGFSALLGIYRPYSTDYNCSAVIPVCVLYRTGFHFENLLVVLHIQSFPTSVLVTPNVYATLLTVIPVFGSCAIYCIKLFLI